MAKVTVIIVIVVSLLTAGLAFVTKGEVEKRQAELKNTKQTLVSTQGTLQKTKSDLTSTTAELTTAKTTIDDQKSQIGTLTTDRDDQKAKAEKASTDLAEATKKLADLNDQLAAIKPDPKTGGTDVAAQIKELTDQRDKLQTEATEQKQIAEGLKAKEAAEESKLAAQTSKLTHYEKQVSREGLTGRVVAVNPGFNFVVLDVGDRQGAAIGSPLIVVRDGRAVGKVKITSVEPGSAIADVVAGSMPAGQSVQPGDRVIFPGSHGQPLQPPPSSGAPVPGATPR